MQCSDIANAITRYDTTYSHYPTMQNPGTNDFTYGGSVLDSMLGTGVWSTNNSEVIAILMDLEKFPSGTSNTVNFGHAKNTQQIKFLNANLVADTNSAGVGLDLVYRDPWGNPYVISMDLNYNDNTQDAFYKFKTVTQQSQASGYNGLNNLTDPTGGTDDFEYHGGVMVWSLGPDKKGTNTVNATTNPNKDNVISWKQ